MIIFKSINKLNKYLENIDNIGFVPTMGSIHNGHSSLIKKSKKSLTTILEKLCNIVISNQKVIKAEILNVYEDFHIIKKLFS